MEEKDTLYIVMPAYNEEANIEAVISEYYSLLKLGSSKSRLTVADSGSTDHTHQILVNLQTKYSQLEILTNTDKQHGPKVIALYNHAIKSGADYIFQTDSDGQTNPAEFTSFWRQRAHYDAIFGHRQVRGDGKARAYVEKVVCRLLNHYFNVNVPDANAPFRLMKAAALQKYMPEIPADYNLPNIILTAFFARGDNKISFQVVSFKPRQAGANSINIPKITKIGWKALSDFHNFKEPINHAK